MGQKWYEEGKMLNKKNTFYDFIDVTQFLISDRYTSPKKFMPGKCWRTLSWNGHQYETRPYNGIYAQVPFVDTLTTMLDPSIL